MHGVDRKKKPANCFGQAKEKGYLRPDVSKTSLIPLTGRRRVEKQTCRNAGPRRATSRQNRISTRKRFEIRLLPSLTCAPIRRLLVTTLCFNSSMQRSQTYTRSFPIRSPIRFQELHHSAMSQFKNESLRQSYHAFLHV